MRVVVVVVVEVVALPGEVGELVAVDFLVTEVVAGAGTNGEPVRVAAVALVVGLRARLLVVLLDAGDSAGVAVPAAEATVSPGAWPTAEAAGGAMAASAAMVSIAVVAEVLRTMPARIQAR